MQLPQKAPRSTYVVTTSQYAGSIGDDADGPQVKKGRSGSRAARFPCQWPGCTANPRRNRSPDKGASGLCGRHIKAVTSADIAADADADAEHAEIVPKVARAVGASPNRRRNSTQ